MKNDYEIDVLITGSSRPKLIPFCFQTFKDKIHFNGEMRIVYHEDFVFPKESEKVIDYLNSQNIIDIDEIYQHNPSIGLGMAMNDMLKNKIKSKYMFYLQEDWMFERPIDLDRILWVMDRNTEINLIFFNKTKNWGRLNEASQPQYTYDDLDMCLYHSWTFLPGIWRMDFVMKHWANSRKERPEGFFSNQFGNHQTRMDNEYCKDNIGAYIYGKTKDWRYVRHIGNDWRCAEWRLKNGTFGGCHDPSRMDDPFMAPWLGTLETTPRSGINYTEEDIQKMLDEEAK